MSVNVLSDEVCFCHLTDSHLGFRQYGLVERFDDFAVSLLDGVNTCIKEKVDFVIFTGDLFDAAKPHAPELRQAVSILSKLNKAKIPLYVSQGNHDVSYSRSRRYGGDILSFLSDFDIFTYIQDEINYVEINGKKIAQILAVNYYGKRTNRILNQLINDNKKEMTEFNGPKILMLHAFVEGMPGITDVKLETIKKGKFNYVGVGHLHERWENKKLNIFCPGSTEHTSSTEWKQPERGIYKVSLKNNSNNWKTAVNYLTIKVRPKLHFQHEFQSKSIPEIREEAEAILLKNDVQDAIIRFVFSGEYKGKEHPFLNLDHYKQIPKKALHTIIVTKFLDSQKREERSKILSKREAYQQVLSFAEVNPKYIDEYVSLIEDSLKIVGEGKIISDQEKQLDNRFSLFAKELSKRFKDTKVKEGV